MVNPLKTLSFQGVSMELLPRFELGTSSLPSDWKLWKRRCLALSGYFCCGGTWSWAISRPLLPPAFFGVWVTVWVKAQIYNSVRYRCFKYSPISPQNVTAPEKRALVSSTEQI